MATIVPICAIFNDPPTHHGVESYVGQMRQSCFVIVVRLSAILNLSVMPTERVEALFHTHMLVVAPILFGVFLCAEVADLGHLHEKAIIEQRHASF